MSGTRISLAELANAGMQNGMYKIIVADCKTMHNAGLELKLLLHMHLLAFLQGSQAACRIPYHDQAA